MTAWLLLRQIGLVLRNELGGIAKGQSVAQVIAQAPCAPLSTVGATRPRVR